MACVVKSIVKSPFLSRAAAAAFSKSASPAKANNIIGNKINPIKKLNFLFIR